MVNFTTYFVMYSNKNEYLVWDDAQTIYRNQDPDKIIDFLLTLKEARFYFIPPTANLEKILKDKQDGK